MISVRVIREDSALFTLFHVHNRALNNICVLWSVYICIRSGP